MGTEEFGARRGPRAGVFSDIQTSDPTPSETFDVVVDAGGDPCGSDRTGDHHIMLEPHARALTGRDGATFDLPWNRSSRRLPHAPRT